MIEHPELKSRRLFVREVWNLANVVSMFELKQELMKDPFMYITSKEILNMLDKKDDKMIHVVLANKVNLLVTEDLMYKTAAIKKQYINEN
jgi:hypothetical protein